MVAMPLTYSITNGIGTGMLFYAFIKIIRGKAHELSPTLCIVALAFLVYFSSHGSCRFWPLTSGLL
jgi:AGZA family xanthine/uracil permease-like MFS transporter